MNLIFFLSVPLVLAQSDISDDDWTSWGKLFLPSWLTPLNQDDSAEIEPRPLAPNHEFECGKRYTLRTGQRGLLQSPNFGLDNYPDNHQCNWQFRTFENCLLNFHCTSVNVTSSPNCTEDYIEVTDSDSVRRRYCGDQVPTGRVWSYTKRLSVTFQTNSDNVTDSGFSCIVSCKVVPRPVDRTSRSQRQANDTDLNCKCGQVANEGRIVGGVEASINAFPWMAGIILHKGKQPYCGGSLINDRYVLTAAHCVQGKTADEVQVILHEHDLNESNEFLDNEPTYRVNLSEIVVHENYSSLTVDFDVALLRLEQPLTPEQLSDKAAMGTICLPVQESESEKMDGLTARVAGWGTLSEGGKLSPVLRQVDVTIIDHSDCIKRYKNKITSRMFCAGSADGGVDSCQGDSGGPLMIKAESGDFYQQIGVVSWGIGCARRGYPGVYARVAFFLPWIAAHTPDAHWCSNANQ